MEARITLVRMGSSSNPDHNTMVFEIEDKTTGLRIVEAQMTMEEFGMLLAGYGSREAKLTAIPDQFVIDNIGKQPEMKTVYLEDLDTRDRAMAEVLINSLIYDYFADGWHVSSHGLTSQQNDPRGHAVHLRRYV